MFNSSAGINLLKREGFEPNIIIDVGVATDTVHLYEHFLDRRYLFVEPLIEFEPNLKHLCKEYWGEYILAAAGAEDGALTINVTPDLGGSSRYQTLDSLDGAYDMIPRRVPQYKLDTLWEIFNCEGPGLLKIDVQGGEMEVLKGAEKCLHNFHAIILEVGLIEQYVGQPILHDYIAYLAERNFVVFDIMENNYAQTGLLGQVDMMFVQKDSIYRADQRWFNNYEDAAQHTNYKGVYRDPNIT
jgi:FkbM family methyltransferase